MQLLFYGNLVIDPMPIMYELEFGNDLIKTATGPSTNAYKFHEKANANTQVSKRRCQPSRQTRTKISEYFQNDNCSKTLV